MKKSVTKTRALALLVVLAAALHLNAQSATELFTTVEIEGWDFSSFDVKVKEAVSKANAADAGERERQAAADALRERADFFWGAGEPSLYKFALGDYRNILRFHLGDKEATERVDMLTSIYTSMRRPVPENGNAKSSARYLVETFKTKPKQIAFKSGDDFADGRTLHTQRVAYVYELDAHAGQHLEIRVVPSDKNIANVAVFDLVREDTAGPPLASGARRGDYLLPSDGKYLIRVYTTNEDAGYEVRVELKNPDI
jgi:hypothetical protein